MRTAASACDLQLSLRMSEVPVRRFRLSLNAPQNTPKNASTRSWARRAPSPHRYVSSRISPGCAARLGVGGAHGKHLWVFDRVRSRALTGLLGWGSPGAVGPPRSCIGRRWA